MIGEKKFSIVEWMSNKHLKVFTLDGLEVDIVSLHFNDPKPIAARLMNGNNELFAFSENQLVMIEPELVLTEFERRVGALICESNVDKIKTTAKGLLSLANSDIEKEIETAKKIGYKIGCEDTEKQMLSWMPKLEDFEITADTPKRAYVSTSNYLVVPKDHFMVSISDLSRLPHKRKDNENS